MRALRVVLVRVLAAVALLYLAGCAALYGWQRSLLYHPQPARQAGESLALPVDGATLQISARARPGAPALLYFGGNAEDVSTTIPQLARLFPDHALYEQVRRGHPYIKLVGRSLGSGVAIRLASETAVTRLVLITPYDSIENVAAEQFPWWPVRWLIRDRFDSAALAGRIDVPTTLIAAEHDTLIRPERTTALMARLGPGVASLVVIPGVGHNDIGASPLYGQALIDAAR